MNNYSAGSPELLRRNSIGTRMSEKYSYSVSEYEDYADDEQIIPGSFDSHPLGWAGSYPHASTRPLIDYCTNEWQKSGSQESYQDPLDSDLDEDEENWYDY